MSELDKYWVWPVSLCSVRPSSPGWHTAPAPDDRYPSLHLCSPRAPVTQQQLLPSKILKYCPYKYLSMINSMKYQAIRCPAPVQKPFLGCVAIWWYSEQPPLHPLVIALLNIPINPGVTHPAQTLTGRSACSPGPACCSPVCCDHTGLSLLATAGRAALVQTDQT